MVQAQIIRGTTPTISFTFNSFSVYDISAAYLVIKQANQTIIEKSIDSAWRDYENNKLSWYLDQEDTLLLSSIIKRALVVCDWVTSNGLRGRSVECWVDVGEPGKNEVINAGGGGGGGIIVMH